MLQICRNRQLELSLILKYIWWENVKVVSYVSVLSEQLPTEKSTLQVISLRKWHKLTANQI